MGHLSAKHAVFSPLGEYFKEDMGPHANLS